MGLLSKTLIWTGSHRELTVAACLPDAAQQRKELMAGQPESMIAPNQNDSENAELNPLSRQIHMTANSFD